MSRILGANSTTDLVKFSVEGVRKCCFMQPAATPAGKGSRLFMLPAGATKKSQPLAVTNLTLANIDGQPHLSFSAPAANTANFPIDSTALVYRIVRHPGDVEVASEHKGNTYVDVATLPLACYTYTVYPVLNGIEGEGATSNGVIFGDALWREPGDAAVLCRRQARADVPHARLAFGRHDAWFMAVAHISIKAFER